MEVFVLGDEDQPVFGGVHPDLAVMRRHKPGAAYVDRLRV